MKSLLKWIALPLLAACVFTQGAGAATSRITVDPQRRFQTIDGFGVNLNGTYFRETQQPLIDMLIDDLGATLFRLDPYGLSNWETVNDNDDPDVMNWEYYNDRYSIPAFEASWAAARYLNSRGIRPLLISSGTPPDWMLDDKAPAPRHRVCKEAAGMSHGQSNKPDHLNPAMHEEFAESITSLVLYARTKARVDFEYFAPLTETDCYPEEGPRIDPDELPKVLGIVAARMKKEGLGGVKLVAAEQALLLNDYIGPIIANPELMKQVGILSLHAYTRDSIRPHVERIEQGEYGHVPVWLTEYGALNDLDKSSDNEWQEFSLNTLQLALQGLNDGARAALVWDAFDNYHEHYPRLTFYGLFHNNDHAYSPKKRYYAAKQLFRFVQTGSQRIEATSNAPGLLVSAFRNPSTSSLTVVGIKRGGVGRIEIALPQADPTTHWEVYRTTRMENCIKVDNLTVKDGIARFDLPDEAIFTLVGSSAPK